MNLKSYQDETLLEKTRQLVGEERRLNLEVIQHLREIATRRLFLDRGYPSLFEMCVTEFKYSPAAAQRRIEAMRLIEDLPEVETKIASGEISLSTAAQVQSFFRKEAKAEKAYTPAAKRELIAVLENKSTREVEKELVKLSPVQALPEKVRWVTDNRVELRLSLDGAEYAKIEKLKHLLSHKDPRMSLEKLIGELAEIALDKLDPVRKDARAQNRKEKKEEEPKKQRKTEQRLSPLPAPETKSIPAAIRRRVQIRDRQVCTFVDPVTGRRCASPHLAQPDHIQPRALGGSHRLENLRLLCAAHNQRRVVQTWPGFQVRPRTV